VFGFLVVFANAAFLCVGFSHGLGRERPTQKKKDHDKNQQKKTKRATQPNEPNRTNEPSSVGGFLCVFVVEFVVVF
jgi:hypothetical protein